MYRYTFRLKPGRDDDLIGWLEALGEGERSYSIRQTLRRGLTGRTTSVQVPVAVEPSRPMAREAIEAVPVAAANDIEERLDRLAESF